jgi:WD40 repeat protein
MKQEGINWTDRDILRSNTFDATQIQLNLLKHLKEKESTKVFWCCWAPASHSSQTSNKRYLLCGDSNGMIQVYAFSHSFLPPKSLEPTFSFLAHNGPIYCYEWVMVQEKQSPSTQSNYILLTGGDQEIRAWNFDQLLQRAENELKQMSILASPLPIILKRCAYEMEMKADEQYVSDRGFALEHAECNTMCYDSVNEKLFSAWGDGNIYVWELENGQKLSSFPVNKQQSNNAFCVAYMLTIANGMIYAACNDGLIRIWDIDTEELVETLNPFTSIDSSVLYPISALAIDSSNTWLAFGGFMSFVVLMYLPNRTVTSILPTPSYVNYLKFTRDGRLISVGNDSFIKIWDMTGSLIAQHTTEIPAIYFVSFDQFKENLTNKNIMVAVGTGTSKNIYVNDISICELKS